MIPYAACANFCNACEANEEIGWQEEVTILILATTIFVSKYFTY